MIKNARGYFYFNILNCFTRNSIAISPALIISLPFKNLSQYILPFNFGAATKFDFRLFRFYHNSNY